MPRGMEQRDAAQHRGPRPAGEGLHQLLGAGAEGAFGRRLLERRRRDLPAPVLVAEVADDLARAAPDGVAVLAQGAQVDLARHLGDLRVAHPDAKVPARDAQALAPRVVAHLVAPVEDRVDHDVLGARDVPHQPRQRVEVLARPHAHLLVAEAGECALRRRGRVAAHGRRLHRRVLREEEILGIHDLCLLQCDGGTCGWPAAASAIAWSLSAGTAPLTPTAPTTWPASTSGTPPLPKTNSYWPRVATLSAKSMRLVKRSSRSSVVARKPAAALALARAISGVTHKAPSMRSQATRWPASSTTAMATLKPRASAFLNPRSMHVRAGSRVTPLTAAPRARRRLPHAPCRTARRRRARGTCTGPCARRTSSHATGTPGACRTACPRSAGRPCGRRRRRARAPDHRRGRGRRARPPSPRASAGRPPRRPAAREWRSRVLFQHVRAVQSAHVLPAHLGRLPHLFQRVCPPLGRVRVALDDLVAALAVDFIGLDVDGEELHLVIVEAVLRLERRQIALVDAGHLRLQPDEQPGGRDVEGLARRLEAPRRQRTGRRQLPRRLDLLAAHAARLAEADQEVDVLGAGFLLDDVLEQEVARVGVRALGVDGRAPAREL